VTSSLTEPLGGAEAYCVRLAIRQAAEYSVAVRTPMIDRATHDRLLNAGVRVEVVPVRRPYPADGHGPNALAKVLFHVLDTLGAIVSPRGYRSADFGGEDVIHVHRFQGIGSSILAQAAGRVVVHTVHDFALVDTRGTATRAGLLVTRLPFHQRARARLNLRAARHATRLLFPSARTLQRHRDLGLRDEANVEILALGWEVDDSDGTDWGRRPYVAFLGKLTGEKGLERLLSAWGSGIDGYDLLIAGEGPLSDVASKRGRDGVRLLGWVNGGEKTALIASATAVVVPSLWPENFPLVVAESMILGVPVVTNLLAAGPLPVDGFSAVVASDTGVEALRDALKVVLLEPDVRDRLAEGARSIGRTLTMDAHLRQLDAIYSASQGRA